MKINVWFNFCRFVIICFLFFSCLFSLPVFAAQVTVCSFGCDYTKIQDAVNAADSGDVVLVKDGTYVENINVYKSLTIKSENGADKTIVQSAGGDTVFKITTSYVTISGFKVSGWIYGIYLYNADYCNIYNNDISNDYDGIRLHNSSNNTITNNSCYSNNHCGILLLYSSSNNNISRNNCSYNHYGIRLIKSLNNNIFNNSIYSIYDGQYYGNGIDLFRSSNTVIINNSIKSRTGNYGCGISISTSSSIDISNNRLINSGIFLGSDVSSESISYFNTHVVEDNTINGRPIYYYKNTKGIKVSEDAGSVIIANCSDMIVENINASVGTVGIELAYTKNSTILSNNVLYNTKGIHSYSSSNTAFLNNNLSGNMVGIYSGYSYNNDISNNKISDCYVGVRFSYSNDNTLLNNKVSNNKYGVYLSDHSDNNIIYSNDFINNLKNTYSYSSTNIWNSLEPITYTYNGKTHTNYLGNYWDDYEEKYPDANEIDWTGIWDISYDIGSNNQDNYSLVEPFENYVTKSVLQVPFIHQVYDTPIAEYYGTWACAPTSAVMIFAYYGRIEKDNIWISHPSPGHNSPYGKYIYQEYTYKEHTFSKKHTEFCVCGKTVTDSGAGAWGYIWKNSYCYDS
ncbi:MAG: right-handed parallel beta-helix repeat-containing protein, partial [Candidatus Aenigmarchaeota archaeon]|nr:right-handed parallel beta-helix repeat-containing protein [Candidatus Aenigmarchaeota archaeon]